MLDEGMTISQCLTSAWQFHNVWRVYVWQLHNAWRVHDNFTMLDKCM